ncbi:hypothetical protein VPNG_08099 [Cytospora leucostoma]|uniref:Aminoglycoside phosphotransferase domain-containing protein n=1 Tax=Cytospora leucostoma TaxID=1230097 RepID=A0A423WS66_9PEZI|nr:hypothetical protein VPNG_08099 [Cytospora leucostoma]
MSEFNQDGLEWDDSGFDLVPCWTREPSTDAIETVCRKSLHLSSDDTCTISFHAAGAFNKLYLVNACDQSLLMRVSLPVYPHYKTRGEVTTLRWLRDNIDIPVPRVIDFDTSNDNEIGFEWILMELMPGSSAWRRWRTLSMAQKVFFTQRVAEFQAQLFRHGFPGASFRGIGTLHSVAEKTSPVPGKMVSHMFFMGDHIKYDVARGPFRSSHDWLRSYFEIAIQEYKVILANTDDEDDKEEAEDVLQVADRLLALLPKIFPSIEEPPERTVLWHDDLGLQNILIDEQGDITAVIDWECVSPLPLWRATRMPKFLRGRDREDEPKRDSYPADTSAGPAASAKDTDPDDLDNEGKDELFWIHLMEYEQTQLRKIYNDKMKSLWPDWTLQVEESKLKFDFYDAAVRCCGGVYLKRILRWVDKIEKGEFADLQTVLHTV